MNFLIGGGLNLTLGLITGLSSTTKSVYDMVSHLSSTNDCDIDALIKETDIMDTITYLVHLGSEIKITPETPYTTQQCIKSLYDAIKEIENELKAIQVKVNYNKSIWLLPSVLPSMRRKKFNNSSERLKKILKIVEKRRKQLRDTLGIQNNLVKNEKLGNDIYSIDKDKLEQSMISKIITNKTLPLISDSEKSKTIKAPVIKTNTCTIEEL
jgi:hypothetical protein